MSAATDELGACIRTWRERVSPEEAGLASSSRRRVHGLRREEVAQLAGVSVDYLARLEQGRARSPSQSVLAALARALRLSDDERAHLFRLAGQAEQTTGMIRRHITPSIQRLLDRLADVPVIVIDAVGEVVASNQLAATLIGDNRSASRRERTIPWRHFTGTSSRLVRTEEETHTAEETMVAELREALGRFPNDEYLRSLIDDLLEVSPRFAELWEQRPVARPAARRKTFLHPELGPITLDCDVLSVEGTDLNLIVYTAPAGSPEARSLALLGAIGLQTFSDGGATRDSTAADTRRSDP